MSEKKTLGIIGGLGPMAGVCLCELIVLHTAAKRDQDHINFLLSSRADIPDRTAFIVGRSEESPLPALITEANRLTAAGADVQGKISTESRQCLARRSVRSGRKIT